jgi:S-adenosylmethionine:tRNA ribosyltransferase-isomerase
VEGIVELRLSRPAVDVMVDHGELPLPPYLGRAEQPADRERYQTVYANEPGSAAAPTAGLHFTEALFAALDDVGVQVARVTLHVGLGTFRPLRPEDLARGRLHEEWREVPEQTVAAIEATRARGGRVIAVGTTSARSLESATPEGQRVPEAVRGSTDLFLRPGYRFRTVDGLLTNFHLPGSSLLMLVAALVGRERLLSAYDTAVRDGYRFYSYGDAMLLL